MTPYPISYLDGSLTHHHLVNRARAAVVNQARAVDPHLQVEIGENLALLIHGAHGIRHPQVNRARADPAVVNLASQEAPRALQEIGVS